MKRFLSAAAYSLVCAGLPLLLSLCFVTAFGVSANLAAPAVCSAFVAVTAALCSLFIKKPLSYALSVAGIAVIISVVLLFLQERLAAELEYIINCVLKIYAAAFDIPPTVSFAGGEAVSADAFFGGVMALYSLLFTVSLIRFKSMLPVALLSLGALIPCFISVDSLPALPALLGTVAVLCGLYLTAFARRYGFSGSGIALTGLVAAMLAVSVLIVNIFPQENFQRFEWQDELLNRIEQLTGITSSRGNGPLASVSNDLTSTIELKKTSSRQNNHIPVMKVISDNSGPLYLRGTAYCNYNDDVWSVLTGEQEQQLPAFDFPYRSAETDFYEVRVITEKTEKVAYAPYFELNVPEDFQRVDDVCIKNDSRLLSYEFDCAAAEDYDYTPPGSSDYEWFVAENYVFTDDSLRESLLDIVYSDDSLTGAMLDGSDYTIARAVQKYVKAAAKYDLDCDIMPEGESFPVWFLTQAERGYCVHFASSACALLRAMGVPARYVTGYYINTDEGVPTPVTSDNAHAWVEYFDGYYGWMPLECTPSDFQLQDVRTVEAEPEETTAVPDQPETQAAPEPTQPPEKPPEEPVRSVSFALPPWFAPLMIILAAPVALVIAEEAVRRALKKRREEGDSRTRAIAVYRSLLIVARLVPLSIPEEVEYVALKARFGSSPPTEAELDLLCKFASDKKSELIKRTPVLKRPVIWFFS